MKGEGETRRTLLLLGGDGRVSVDDLGENSAGGLDTYSDRKMSPANRGRGTSTYRE